MGINWGMVKSGAKTALKTALRYNPALVAPTLLSVTVIDGYKSGMNFVMGAVGLGYEGTLNHAKAKVDSVSAADAQTWYDKMFVSKTQCQEFMGEIPAQTERRKLRFCQHCSYRCEITHGDMEMFKSVLRYQLNQAPATPIGYAIENPPDIPDIPGMPSLPSLPSLPSIPDISGGVKRSLQVSALVVIGVILLIFYMLTGRGGKKGGVTVVT
jgi:hypothetical protein